MLNWHGKLSVQDKIHSTVFLERGAPCLMETSCSCHRPAGGSFQHTGLLDLEVHGSPPLSLHSALGREHRPGDGKALMSGRNLGFCAKPHQPFLLPPPSATSQCHLMSFPEGTPDHPCCVLGGLSPLLPKDYRAHGTKTSLPWTLAHRTHPTGASCLIRFVLSIAGL